MSEGSICKYNQRGYCKFKQSCRKRHENKTCKEENACNIKECIYRHPKVCINFVGENSCRFGEDCAYKHKDINSMPPVKENILKHAKEINNIQNELTMLKGIITSMENKINDLVQEIEIGQKKKIEEVVRLVVSMLDSSKQSVESSEADQQDNTEAQCDICSYKCENEDLLINHMSKKHVESYSCNLCAEYFGTNKSLRCHNKYFHNVKHSSSESESESDQVVQTDNKNYRKNKQKKKKSRK